MNPGRKLSQIAKQYPQKIGIVYRDEALDYATMNRRANRLAHALLDLGISQGDKIGLLIPNSPEFVIAYLGILKTGAIAVPFDHRLKREEIEKHLEFTEARLLISCPAIEFLTDSGLQVLLLEKDSIIFNQRSLEPSESDVGVDLPSEMEATYLQTSGSSGIPKMTILTLDNLESFVRTMKEAFEVDPAEVYGMLLPMSHISGPITIHTFIGTAAELVIIDALHARAILQSMERNGVTFAWTVPPIARLLIPEALTQKFDTRNLRVLAVLGMEVPLRLMEELTRAFPSTAVIQGYGMTETTGMVTATLPKDAKRKMNSIGRPSSFIDIKITSAEGNPLPSGEYGEITVKGPSVMKGYYKNQEATGKCLKNGWFYTGDIGYFDEEGYFYYLGRKDDMIISGGINVFPAEVEDVIRSHPAVKDVAVVGVPDEKRGEIIQAVIVTDGVVSEKEILEFCREKLPIFKCPQKILFNTELPMTRTGKIARSQAKNIQES
jgi:long-chain acyl-CoA synthetase